MTEPTIEQLIDELLAANYVGSCYDTARAALLSRIAALQQESDEWQRVADELAGELNEANSERFPVSWEDASESSPAWIAYNNLRDRKEIKTSSDNNVEIFHKHIKDLNTSIDKVGTLVARAIDWLPSEKFSLIAELRIALDELTEVQNREYRNTNSQELLDTATGISE